MSTARPRRSQVPFLIGLVVVGGIGGIVIFGILVAGATTVERVEAPSAAARFRAVRAALPSRPPMLVRDAAGELVPTERAPTAATAAPSQFSVMSFEASDEQLVRIDAPFWFIRLKGPAVQFALRRTSFDLEDLGLTADDLARHGPGIVLDESHANGDRVLVWLE